MGLSASQTRFLSLTARKSNVEFQGQQINQARTALANQSSALYAQMMSLQAPIAPSKYKYVIDPATNPNIDWTNATAYPLNPEATKNFDVYYAANAPKFVDFNIPEWNIKTENGAAIWSKKAYDDNGKAIVSEQFKAITTTNNENKTSQTVWQEAAKDENGNFLIDEEGNQVYNNKYCSKTDENGKTTWYAYGVDGISIDEENPLTGSPFGTYCTTMEGVLGNGNSVTYTGVVVPDDANYTYDAKTGRFVEKEGFDYINLPSYIRAYNDAMGTYDKYSDPISTYVYSTEADLTTLSTEDVNDDAVPVGVSSRSPRVSFNDAQYNAAFAQYEKDLKEYNQALEVINAKTEQIHESDKKLELQLKQLDTEQEAIQTEYEAVKKVIEKNIENTFKTFA